MREQIAMNAGVDRRQRQRNTFVVALKRAIEATFSTSDWSELGYATNTKEWISTHPRLLRSLQWGDDDYGDQVLSAIEHILDQEPANLQVLLDFNGLERWIRENQPKLYAEALGGPLPTLTTLADPQQAALGFDVEDHIRRIREALPNDPALAVGSTKELLETVFKTVLGLHGAELNAEDMPKLLKRTQTALGIDPKAVDDGAPGGEAFRRLLGSLAQVVVSVTELRNLYGTGHGKSQAPGLDTPAAQLVVGAGTTLAVYLMERYRQVKQ